MSTRFDDLELVAQIGRDYPEKITPAFGLHPWFCHRLSRDSAHVSSKASSDASTEAEDRRKVRVAHYQSILEPTPDESDPILDLLPDPIPLSAHMNRIEKLLCSFPNALVGEVGLDKQFKVKHDGKIYPFRVKMSHQRLVLREQVELARRHGRSMSLHGVGAAQAVFDEIALAANKPPEHGVPGLASVCLHSYSGSAEFYGQRWLKLPIKVYLSMTPLIAERMDPNRLWTMLGGALASLVLTESDFNRADLHHLVLIQRSLDMLSQRFGWTAEEAERIVEQNYNEFLKVRTLDSARSRSSSPE